jgi:antitoxin protein of toxin-antitoxin system
MAGMFRKLAVLGAAAEAARRFARNNPEKARELTEKAAAFADKQTKGRYKGQIDSVKRSVANAGGFGDPGGNHYGPTAHDPYQQPPAQPPAQQPKPYKPEH